MVATLRLSDYLGPGAAYHVARVTLDRSSTPHRHDFPELFWVAAGRGTHLIGDHPLPVEQGDLTLVRPEDVHVLRSSVEEPLTIVNLAFRPATLAFLRDRHFPEGGWPWEEGEVPEPRRLDPARLGNLAARLVVGPPTPLLLEHLLLEVLADLTHPLVTSALPSWLEEGLRRLPHHLEALTEGAGGLASLVGRSREHVNRVLRAHTGRTATETVNEIRLGRAALLLRMTDHPITRVAVESGLPNLSYFYRLFRARFGTTPRRYRLAHQSLIRGRPEG